MVHSLIRRYLYAVTPVTLALFSFALPGLWAQAQGKDAPDVLVLSDGDILHGKLVNAVSGKVTFHTESLGDVTVDWEKIKELHSAQKFAVLSKDHKLGRKNRSKYPLGAIDITGGTIAVQTEGGNPVAPIPVKSAEYLVDLPTLDKQMYHEPSLLTGWNGAATAGATLVQATQNQYTVSGALALVRVVPAVTWLTPRNRTAADFSGSYGKITQPGIAPTKSAIYHVDAERDQYVSDHLYALGQVAFDHNFAQDLDLQQVYGGGFGWTLFSSPAHTADVKATLQYEKQQFISGTSGTDQNLIGSTFSASYLRHMKLVTYSQLIEFLPSYNTPRAYSASEVDTFAFPAYKNFSFSIGTNDSYLNNPPTSVPSTKRNSFQFTMGLTYAIKSKY